MERAKTGGESPKNTRKSNLEDDDDLRDDIEDKNASFSEYSIAKAASTQNTSRSGNSTGSANSSGQKKKKKKRSVFKQLFNRFSKMIGNGR